MKALNQLKDYVPRHLRLGVCCDVPVVESFQDVPVDIPVVDESGNVIEVSKSIKRVPAVEAMQQYKLDAFRLSALVRNGVPLKLVNVNKSSVMTIDELEHVCQKLDDAESYVARVIEQQKERQSWFEPFETSNVES